MSDPASESNARTDLAAALRWASRLGFGEGICNHFSMALPGEDDRFLINPQGLHWSEVTPADLVDHPADDDAGGHGAERIAVCRMKKMMEQGKHRTRAAGEFCLTDENCRAEKPQRPDCSVCRFGITSTHQRLAAGRRRK